MATAIKIKRSGSTGVAPSDLEYGELAINYADGKLFYKNSSDQIATLVDPSTTSNVTFDVVARSGSVTTNLTAAQQAFLSYDDVMYRNPVAIIIGRSGNVEVTG